MRPIEKIVIDANALLSILIGGAAARRILIHPHAPALYVTPDVRREVEEYIPVLANRKKLDEVLLWSVWNAIALTNVIPDPHADTWDQAVAVMAQRDPDDVPTLAVALEYGLPVWSQDRDFEEARSICSVYTTAELLRILDFDSLMKGAP